MALFFFFHLHIDILFFSGVGFYILPLLSLQIRDAFRLDAVEYNMRSGRGPGPG